MRRVLLAAAVVLGLLGGCAGNQQYSQTELTALQSRTVDAGYDAAYDAAVGALFDAGYMIGASDKRGGLLTASRVSADFWQGVASNTVQIKLAAAGARTEIRISTHVGGQAQVDKATIDKLHELIQRRLVSGAQGAGG